MAELKMRQGELYFGSFDFLKEALFLAYEEGFTEAVVRMQAVPKSRRKFYEWPQLRACFDTWLAGWGRKRI